ncbi:MAG: OmpA family protein, partial [Hoeflea sp.]|nr:OmpA family protein [Hoeflea sp.]
LGGAIGKLAEGITVSPTEGGLLVSITDQLDFGMFRVGSAVPERDLVVAMEKIGQLLAERPGAIAIRGHTDARPFASGTDDNWRLSMARAHSALFMLVRGGVPEERIVQVSGFADKRLKDRENPLSEVNRRIEILVEAGGS